MADLDELGPSVSGVRFPEMRAAVRDALQSLSDPEYQRRVWIERQFPHPGFYDDLDVNISALYDDSAVVPEPRGRIGTVLVEGPEIDRLHELDQVLGPLIRRLGDVPDGAYLADPEWPRVIAAARAALAAMSA